MEFCENYVIIIKRKKEAEASLFNEIEESSLLPSHEDYGHAGDDDRNDHDSAIMGKSDSPLAFLSTVR